MKKIKRAYCYSILIKLLYILLTCFPRAPTKSTYEKTTTTTTTILYYNY